MKITILYDNDVAVEGLGLKGDHGFACLVEFKGVRVLFDTGEKGPVLLNNMKALKVEPASLDEVFISHGDSDHIGGLADLLKLKPAKVYVPAACPEPQGASEVIKVKAPFQLRENMYSTGQLGNEEQSLVVKTGKGLVIIVGCSHPGVGNILKSAAQFGKPFALIGGLHGFREFDVVKDLELICPTHCTKRKAEIRELYPDKCIAGGVGKVIQIDD